MEISELFTSSAKYKILGVLSSRRSPIHLRAIAEISGVQIRSAQLAIRSLNDDKILRMTREGNRTLYTLNQKSELCLPLREHFSDEQARILAKRAKSYPPVGQLLERIHELRMLTWN